MPEILLGCLDVDVVTVNIDHPPVYVEKGTGEALAELCLKERSVTTCRRLALELNTVVRRTMQGTPVRLLRQKDLDELLVILRQLPLDVCNSRLLLEMEGFLDTRVSNPVPVDLE